MTGGMSVSCVGTCSACGIRRFWLSDTLSLQMDDGTLQCLRHPGESGDCEDRGLTLAQASQRGRLYRESFFVCHHCGDGEIIEVVPTRFEEMLVRAFSMRGSIQIAVVLILIPLPLAIRLQWWQAALLIGCFAIALPWTAWRAHRKEAAALALRGLPRPDAPGRVSVGRPEVGCVPGTVIGHKIGDSKDGPSATGPCCERPNWKWAGSQRDEDQIPCYACDRGVMTVSELSIH